MTRTMVCNYYAFRGIQYPENQKPLVWKRLLVKYAGIE